MTEGRCATHRRRPAATSCAVCGRSLCRDCVVQTGVGFKCASCTGAKAVAAQPAAEHGRTRTRTRTWRPGTVGVTVAVVAVILAGLAALAIFRPSPMADTGADAGAQGAAAGDGDGGSQVSFSSDDGVTLRGTLDIADDHQGHSPAVVIVGGFGPTDRHGVGDEDAVYRDLGAELADRGLVVLRYDKRGSGESDANPEHTPLTFDQRIADAAAAVAYVRDRPEVDGGQVALVGHDEGGLAALRVAGHDHNINGLVLVGTPGRPFVEVVTEAYRDADDDEHDEIADEIEAAVEELLATGDLPEMGDLGMGAERILPEGQDEYLRGLFAADPVADAAEVAAPTLIVHGERDPNINADTDVEPLRQALGDQAEVLSLAGVGHTLNMVDDEGDGLAEDDTGGGAGAVERDSDALEQIAEWLTDRFDER